MVCVTALLAAVIAWFPLSPPVEAASPPSLAAIPMVCDFDCRCTVVLGTPNDEEVELLCYEKVTMELLTSTTGCCDGSATCTQADDCSWTVKITVENDSEEDECCYEIIKDGNEIYENSCTDSFSHQDSDTAACGGSHLYVLRGEGADCPHTPMMPAECSS
jgi:hypothetical protein